jgi:hypothetical protein
MLRIMNDARKPEAIRLEAAKAAAPYLQPKLSSVDLTANSVPEIQSHEALIERLGELIQQHPELAASLLKAAQDHNISIPGATLN